MEARVMGVGWAVVCGVVVLQQRVERRLSATVPSDSRSLAQLAATTGQAGALALRRASCGRPGKSAGNVRSREAQQRTFPCTLPQYY